MADAPPATKRKIEINSAELADDVESQIESVLVLDRLAMPDTFTVVFRDPNHDVLGRAHLEVGKKVKISTTKGDAPKPLIDGEVTSIEADYDSLGARAIVRGYDLSHRLNAGRKTKTFQNVKYSDVASQLASGAGLTAEVDDSTETYEHVLQPNVSDLDFLYSLARRIGYDLRVDGKKLMFKKPPESSSGPGAGEVGTEKSTELIWNDTLLEFRCRISAVAQVKEVQVRGWDVKNKKAIIGKANTSVTHAELTKPITPASLADKVKGKTLVVVDRPVGTQQGADAIAAAKAEEAGSAGFEATALAVGSSDLKAGTVVSISGVDPALEGKWAISSSRHEFGAGPYRTHLEFSGRLDRSLHGVVANGLPGSAGEGNRIAGVAIAIVTNNDDPDKMCRVKVKYPWLSDDAESHWARMAAPGAGPDSGMIWLPEVNDEVLVAFEQGDMAYPVVVGYLWNGKDKPLLGQGLLDGSTVKRRGFVSRKGHKFIFFDGDDKSGIAMLSQDGKFKISLNETKGQFHIKADGKLLIEAKSLEIKVDTDAKLTGTGVSLEASGQMKIKGATVALN